MKIKAKLIQPAVSKAAFAECEIEVKESDSEETIKLKAAHVLMQNFEIEIKRVK